MAEELIAGYAAFTTADEYGAASAGSPFGLMLPTTSVLWAHVSVCASFNFHC